MIYTPKDAPFKTTPKSLEGFICVVQRFSPKSAKRFFVEVGILGFGKKCHYFQLLLYVVSIDPIFSFSTFANCQTMIYTPKDAPFKTTPKSREASITLIQRFSPKSAKRLFFEVGILGFGKRCLKFQLFLQVVSIDPIFSFSTFANFQTMIYTV